MVTVGRSNNSNYLQLIPNRSLTWRQTQLAMAVLGVVTVSFALVWSLLGLWLILPFAGLELALVYALVFRVCRATYQQQVVVFKDNEIDVQWGQCAPERRRTLQRSKSTLHVIQPRHSLSAQTLVLTDGRQRVAVADKLNAQDVKHALAFLKAQGLPVRITGQTEIVATKGPLSEADLNVR